MLHLPNFYQVAHGQFACSPGALKHMTKTMQNCMVILNTGHVHNLGELMFDMCGDLAATPTKNHHNKVHFNFPIQQMSM